MTTSVIGALRVALGMDSAAFERGADASAKKARHLERSLGGVGSAAKASFAQLKGFGAGLLGGLGFEAVISTSLRTIKSIADIADEAKKLGQSTDEYQTMRVTAELAGVEVEALAKATKTLAINSADAARGGGAFGKLLRDNNLSVLDANGKMKSQAEILGIVADLYRNAASEQDRLKIAQIAGGKSMSELAGLLEGGAHGVRRAHEQTSKVVSKLAGEQIAAAAKLDDEITILVDNVSVDLKGAFLAVAQEALPFFKATKEELALIAEVARKAGEYVQGLFGDTQNSVVEGQRSQARALEDEIKDLEAQLNDPDRIALAVDAGVLDRSNNELMAQIDDRRARLQEVVRLLQDTAAAGPVASGVRRAAVDMPPKPVDLDPAMLNFPNTKKTKVTGDDDEEAARKAAELARQANDELKRRRELIAGVINDLKFEGQQLRRNAEEQAVAIELRRADVTATSAKGREIAEVARQNFRVAEAQKLQAANVELNKQAEEELIALRIAAGEELRVRMLDEQQAMKDGLRELGSYGTDLMSNMFDGLIDDTLSAKDAVIQLGKELAVAALKGALFNEGPLSGLFGSIFKSALPVSTGFYADGGRMNPNQWSVVGEEGPELIPPQGISRTVITHGESMKLLGKMGKDIASGGGSKHPPQGISRTVIPHGENMKALSEMGQEVRQGQKTSSGDGFKGLLKNAEALPAMTEFFADGGHMNPSRWSVVGAEGLELVPPQGMGRTAFSSNAVESMTAGGGGMTINYAPVQSFSGGIDEASQRRFAQDMRRQWASDLPGLLRDHTGRGRV